MKITILDFERSEELEFASTKQAREYCESVGWDFEYLARYVNDWNMKNDAKYNEWLEVNCHNSYGFIVPTNALYSAGDLYAMIEYWHEQIAFGKFGDESVKFKFTTEAKQRGYDNFTTDKWLKDNLKTWEELVIDTGIHDYCEHWDELEKQYGEIASAEDLTAEQEATQDKIYTDCEDYQIDQYIYESGSGYYGAKDIDRGTKRAYILQINEYAEVA